MSNKASTQKNKMWGGRFADQPDAVMEAINASISYDKRLWRQDIAGSKAHAAMLAHKNIISKQDYVDILKGLDQIVDEIETDKFTFSAALEDIHMNIEQRLTEIIGPAAGRLHTARSRNDQVATDTKLWLRDVTDHTIKLLTDIQKIILKRAEDYADAVIPGFTHLQTAQPVTFGHHLMAYYEMFERDKTRFIDARARANESPLGAAALAGTVYDTDRFMTAEALEFDRPSRNSLDSVSDRDFALEYMAAAAIAAGHMSRFAEEIVIWMTPQFGFVSLSDQWTTGSSIMPQKKNPDAAELVRAKTGRINGNLIALLTVIKGLPLAYSKDMQEDKEALFDTVDHLELALTAMRGMLSDLKANTDKMRHAANAGFSVATDLADWLVKSLGLPFRQAHHVTGALVKYAEDHNLTLDQIPLAEMQKIEPNITEDIYHVLTVDASVAARQSYGGTAPDQVRLQIKERKLCL
ncbi:MAG: argininosuccinate lyase [Pseudomonadota bacterium]